MEADFLLKIRGRYIPLPVGDCPLGHCPVHRLFDRSRPPALCVLLLNLRNLYHFVLQPHTNRNPQEATQFSRRENLATSSRCREAPLSPNASDVGGVSPNKEEKCPESTLVWS